MSQRARPEAPRTVGIILFTGVEPLDFAGPYEVLSGARDDDGPLFRVATVAEASPVTCQFGLRVLPDQLFADQPWFDVLVVPGGPGTRIEEPKVRPTVEFIRQAAQRARLVAGVCTGTYLMAMAGLTTGRRVATHHAYRQTLRESYPDLSVTDDKVVHDREIITAAGVSSGIDMALYLVELLHGPEAEARERRRIEYGIHI